MLRPAIRSNRVVIAACATALALAPSPTAAQQIDPVSAGGPDADTSPHRSAAVAVDGVRIHYLDWGGTGPALVFIPGFSNSAHVFDEFAPRFAGQFRVVAITRVGFGESDQPEGHGYDLTSRVAQIGAVLDSLGLTRVALAGHSLGGDEITAFASAHPERTAGLVYLDAAYDHVEARKAQQAMEPFLVERPQPGPADRASASAYAAYLVRASGLRYPLGEVLAIYEFDSNGAVRGSRTPARVVQATREAFRPLDYSRVRAPALALYADWESAADIMPWLRADPAANASATATLRASVGAWQDAERARFAREMPGAQVRIFRSRHYQFLSHPDETERLMRAFLLTLPDSRRR